MHASLFRVIRRTGRRIRLQRALEAASTAGLLAVLAVTVLIYLLKLRLIPVAALWLYLLPALALPLAAALWGSLRRVPMAHVAKRIDTSHALFDRLGSALEFLRARDRSPFMEAQIHDAVAHAAQVSPGRAAPLRWPRHARPLALLVLCLGLTTLVRFPLATTTPPPQRPIARLTVPALELDPYRAQVQELEKLAREETIPEGTELAEELNALFDKIQRKELTRKELLQKLAELEQKYFTGLDGDFDELNKRLKKMGQSLSKDRLTKDAGEALKRSRLRQAQKALQDLAAKVERLKKAQQQLLARTLDQAARQKLDASSLNKQQRQLERQLRRLRKRGSRSPKDQVARRRLQKKQRQLQRLNRRRDQHTARQRQLQRLNRQLSRAAASLRQRLSKEAAEALRKAAQQTGRFANQVNKLRMLSRAQGQMADLKEMLRRSKGGKGRQGKLRDFYVRAGGAKQGKQGKQGNKGNQGKGAALLSPTPGGQGVVMGEQQGAGEGQDNPTGQPADGVGQGSDPHLRGQATRLRSRRKQSLVSGKEGKGATRSEVILGASDQGFATHQYQKVFSDYSQVVEDVLKREDVPLGYKYFVKRYFQIIRPR